MLKIIRSFFLSRKYSKEEVLRIQYVEDLVGTQVNNPILFFKALTHRSKLADKKLNDTDSYEQLEFLGDAVLDLIVSELLFEKYPNENEGFMTKTRSKLVKGVTLARLSKKLDISSYLIIGNRAKGQGVEFSNSVLADVFEALIGALYRDKGYNHCQRFVKRVYKTHVDIEQLVQVQDNYKSVLLEYTQSERMTIPSYRVLAENGPAHNKEFHVGVFIGDDMVGDGRGSNKKKAEQASAYLALKKMNILDDIS